MSVRIRTTALSPNIVARILGAGMFKAYRVRLPGLIATLATALMPVVLHSAIGSGGTSGKILSILGTWTGTWTNANNITTGTESFVVQTQVGSTITGFFCWDITQDPATCSSNINDYESWSGTIDWSCPVSVDSLSSSFLDLVSINLTPQARSAAAGGRSLLAYFFFSPPKTDPV